MQILSDMKLDGDKYEGGEILDPANGKFYRCKLWLEGDVLQVRGYLGFFYRTQQWHRAKAPAKKAKEADENSEAERDTTD